MYIIITKDLKKTAVIKDKTEIAHYINIPVRTVRRELKNTDRWEIDNYIVISPDYIKIKSNSGGKREKKEEY